MSKERNLRVWHYPVLKDSDIFQFWRILTFSGFKRFWHFPILTSSDSDVFRFWRFPILSFSGFDKKWILTFSDSDMFSAPVLLHIHACIHPWSLFTHTPSTMNDDLIEVDLKVTDWVWSCGFLNVRYQHTFKLLPRSKLVVESALGWEKGPLEDLSHWPNWVPLSMKCNLLHSIYSNVKFGRLFFHAGMHISSIST